MTPFLSECWGRGEEEYIALLKKLTRTKKNDWSADNNAGNACEPAASPDVELCGTLANIARYHSLCHRLVALL